MGNGNNNLLGGLMIGANLFNAGASNRTSRRNTDRTIKANMEMAEYAYGQDKAAAELAYNRGLEMWNIQNQYNDPQQQIARLRAAGLNPALVYGTGSVAGNQSGPPPQYDPPKYQAPDIQHRVQPFQVPEMLGVFQDFQMRQAQIDNIRAQTENIHARTVSESFKKLLLEFGAKTSEFDLKRRQDLSPYQQTITENQAAKSGLDVAEQVKRLTLMDQSQVLRDLDIEYKKAGLSVQQIDKERKEAELLFANYRNQWTQMGVTSSDNVILRVLIRMMNQSGLKNPFE